MFLFNCHRIFLRFSISSNSKLTSNIGRCLSSFILPTRKLSYFRKANHVGKTTFLNSFKNNFDLKNGLRKFSLSSYLSQTTKNYQRSNQNTISYIGMGGDPTLSRKIGLVQTMEPIRERKINVSFNADHHSSMQWNFKPSQNMLTVVPGETALAFYTAKNPTNEPIVGIATYNVVPFQAGLYFNKIQCFCFEEQWLNPNEEVDMPVFFYIDPDYDDDPQLAHVDDIILSYTFFKAQEGQTIPLPGFMKANSVVNLNEAKAESTWQE